MIPIDRSQAQAPAHLDNADTWGRELCEARRAWHADGKPGDRPDALSKHYRHQSVKDALESLVGKKCWYCEDKVRRYDIEHFYPQSIYPLLAYRWLNLLLACQTCNQNYKKNRFPLLPNGVQAIEDTAAPQSRDDSDSPMLIDPSRETDIHTHLTFRVGRILGLTRRGRVTIRICGLQDSDLLEDRIEHHAIIRPLIATLIKAEREQNTEESAKLRATLKHAARDRALFAGMVRAELTRQGYDWQTL
jgi:uncharacterized protein (TIGR02646 family)